MNVRKVIISLSFMAILSLCTLTVAVASESEPTTAIHVRYTTNATAQQPTTLSFYAPAQAKTLQPAPVYGYLTSANGTGIRDAKIELQEFNMYGDARWHFLSVVSTTDDKGYFNDTVVILSNIFATKGGYHFRATYGGDAQYGPSVSNEVIVAVSK